MASVSSTAREYLGGFSGCSRSRNSRSSGRLWKRQPDAIATSSTPISDGLGRKKPLLAGLVAFTVLSIACAVAPDIGALIVFRFLQGMAGAGGVVLSLIGVFVILLHGDPTALASIQFNKGDLLFLIAMVVFALYSVLTLKRPAIHGLSFAAFTFGAGAAALIPLLIYEVFTRPAMTFDTHNLLTLFYVAVFPSIVAYLCFNRGVQLIGANRAAPFFHMVPVFGAAMAMIFIGERPQLFHFIGFALVLTGVFVASRKASA